MEHARLATWIDLYEQAWRSPGTDWLEYLFAPEATYSMEPFEPPVTGLDAIAELWQRERASHDEVFRMESEIVAVEGDTGVVRVEVTYGDPVRQEYRDLWVIRFDAEGRCVAFEEWPFWPGKGTHAPGAPAPDG